LVQICSVRRIPLQLVEGDVFDHRERTHASRSIAGSEAARHPTQAHFVAKQQLIAAKAAIRTC
jgi:hypothetical protein